MASIPGKTTCILPVGCLDVGIGPLGQQQFASIQLARIGRQHQGGPTILIQGVERGALLDKEGHDIDVSGIGGEEECRFFSVVLLVDVGVSD